MRPRTIFITGTDTGVGKTVLTALLLTHLRNLPSPVRALKPFCSGDRRDVELLHSLQDGELTVKQINPFYFSEPLAPLVAARLHRRSIALKQVLHAIQRAWLYPPRPANRNPQSPIHRTVSPLLLIEGAGGLMVPLGEDCLVLDLIRHLRSKVIVVASNRLGVINHTLLTVRMLRAATLSVMGVVLMNLPGKDVSCASNPAILAELLAPTRLFLLPNLGPNCKETTTLRKHEKKLSGTLAKILGEATNGHGR